MKGFPDLPPLWLALFLVLNWVVASALGGWQSALLTGMSWVFIGLGLAVIGWSALWFWRRKTTIEPHHAPGALIVEGPPAALPDLGGLVLLGPDSTLCPPGGGRLARRVRCVGAGLFRRDPTLDLSNLNKCSQRLDWCENALRGTQP